MHILYRPQSRLFGLMTITLNLKVIEYGSRKRDTQLVDIVICHLNPITILQHT